MLSDSAKRAGLSYVIFRLVRVFMWVDPSIEFIPDEALRSSEFSLRGYLLFVNGTHQQSVLTGADDFAQSPSEYLRNDTRDCACVSAATCWGWRVAPPLYTSLYCSQPSTVKKKRINWVISLNRDFLWRQHHCLTDKTVSYPGPRPKLSWFPHSPALQGLHPNCLYSCLDKHLFCEVSRPLAAFPFCSTPVHGSHRCVNQGCTDSIAAISVSFQVIRSTRGEN